MRIRLSTEEDLAVIMDIYAYAREFMAAHDNPNQWGPNKWPPEELIREDIRQKQSYVCEEDDRIVGVFFYNYGVDVEPTYEVIEDGAWIGRGPYGVIHRIAGDGSVKGIGSFCINWAYQQSGHLRIDTHEDNYVMQNLLKKLGFQRCGIIHIVEGNAPRIAFEKI